MSLAAENDADPELQSRAEAGSGGVDQALNGWSQLILEHGIERNRGVAAGDDRHRYFQGCECLFLNFGGSGYGDAAASVPLIAYDDAPRRLR
jgi:hypothetical protein